MKGTPQNIAAVLAALTLAGVVATIGSMTAQQPACLHSQDESAAQQTRRRGALALTRQINSYEVVAKQRTQTYQSPASLPNLMATPAGFDVHFATDGSSYAFSVKDTLDPCAFAYFSDETGVIYTGQALQ
jgi:hypothetical protein